MNDFGIKSVFTATVLTMSVSTALADTKPLPTFQEGDRAVLTVESNGKTMTIDTADMMYNPLDKQYGEPIEKGDSVYVYGEVDDEFFSKREISANSVVKLRDASEQS
ncbi:hypothetical protein [Allohahella marinimesophila]|uniref:DUF5666 domain-containing protein n=1 Tax=Allohahella marinimesophila TaxID=1054972 RepID=A0ABP7PS16_9GAMM